MIGKSKIQNGYISNTLDKRKDLCPSPTSFQSTSENYSFLYRESSKEEWTYAGSISQGKTTTAWF
ncbi:hypothetical protein RND71_036892 [Anisodus tanguticus]|uniref:Uncharacterized protein n=1 Tax=Anisodus tanguticus TaxID=243964 RepID=A0AAE1R2B0_9SOLA|nr:hypothetical protein RND71_036892 [Anisodus tanguticus]